MSLNKQQIHYLRTKAHDLKPVVIVGQAGLHEKVQHEIQLALDHHELIKVRLPATKEKPQMITQILEQTQASLVQKIGHILIIFLVKKEDSSFSALKKMS